MMPAERLRKIANELLELADELAAPPMADAGAPIGAPSQDSRDELVSLKNAAAILRKNYDAMRVLATRKKAIVKVVGAAFVWKTWLLSQQPCAVRNVRFVRSVAEQSASEA